jgi:hypothetical protein
MNKILIRAVASTVAFAAGVGVYILWFTFTLPSDYQVQGPHVELVTPLVPAEQSFLTTLEGGSNLHRCVGPNKMKKYRTEAVGSAYSVYGGLLNWRVLCGPLPTYPTNVDAIGAVVLEVLIDEQGEVATTKPLSGHPSFVPGAVEAASKTRFFPVQVGGNLVKVRGLLKYDFSPGEVHLRTR